MPAKRLKERLKKIGIRGAMRQLLRIVARLQLAYGGRKAFTLDGRLLGDIGEVLVEEEYDLTLLPGLQKHYDARDRKGRPVQIKATMKRSLTFPVRHTPKYYIGVVIRPNGTLEEIFNGPGRIAARAVKERARNGNLHSISITALRALNETVQRKDRIPRRVRVAAKVARVDRS